MSPRAKREQRYWLLKSEPDVFSFDDLWTAPKRTTLWDGVRNYQARNFMRDDMRVGDGVLFYHSSSDPVGIAGLAEIVREAYPDPTQFDPNDPHHDPGSKPDEPRWVAVDVRAVRRFDSLLTLARLKASPALAGMELLRRGSRLSVQPVRPEEWAEILRMGESGPAGAGEGPPGRGRTRAGAKAAARRRRAP